LSTLDCIKALFFCALTSTVQDGGLFGLFKTTAFIATDPRNAAQIEVNEHIGLSTVN
jgi:hypothetical protein